MEVAKVTSKGQITIPIPIRRKLEINEGDKVLFIYKPEGVMMVNPNNMSGGYDGDIVEAAETKMAAEAVAAMKEKKSSGSTQPKAAAAVREEEDIIIEEATVEEKEYTQPEIRRPAPPPVEEPEKPEKHIGGLNLGSLLDDIRSIGSNI